MKLLLLFMAFFGVCSRADDQAPPKPIVDFGDVIARVENPGWELLDKPLKIDLTRYGDLLIDSPTLKQKIRHHLSPIAFSLLLKKIELVMNEGVEESIFQSDIECSSLDGKSLLIAPFAKKLEKKRSIDNFSL